MNSLSLRELQIWMKWALTDPRGVDAVLADSMAEPIPSALSTITGAPSLTVPQRLDIYAEAFFSRLHEILATDFPRAQQLLGKSLFQNLVAQYLIDHPSRNPNINEVGRELSSFIENLAVDDDLPFVKHVAEVEFTMLEILWTPTMTPVDQSHLQRLSEDDYAKVTPALNPSLRWFESEWPLDAIFKTELPELNADVVSSLNRIETFILYRNTRGLHVRRLNRLQKLLLEKMRDGLTLSELFMAVDNHITDDDAPLIMTWFNEWIFEQIICGLHHRK